MAFRSLQEKRWAKFFDLIGVQYIHNPPHVKIDDDFYYSPSFYLPKIDISFIPSPNSQEGVYFDVVTEDDYMNSGFAAKFPMPILTGNLLPVSPSENTESLSSEQMIDGRYSFMTLFEYVVVAETHYHTLKQERWNEQAQSYDKDRMMIPFTEAKDANEMQ
ncbi:hypothetical protein ACRN97_05130 [Shewanella baltica]|uniref:hypothetical protein n=1 Tax=Shewanella baltica TaxID=62322 RepID=UPI003D79F990